MSIKLFFILLNFFILLVYAKFYFIFYKEKVIFKKFFIGYLILYLIYIFIIYLFYGKYYLNFYFSLILSNFFLFLILYFSITIKSHQSPTDIIFNTILKNQKYNFILDHLKKKKLISLRLKDLKKQGIIIIDKKYFKLSPLGLRFIKFFNFFKNFFSLNSKG